MRNDIVFDCYMKLNHLIPYILIGVLNSIHAQELIPLKDCNSTRMHKIHPATAGYAASRLSCTKSSVYMPEYQLFSNSIQVEEENFNKRKSIKIPQLINHPVCMGFTLNNETEVPLQPVGFMCTYTLHGDDLAIFT